MTGLLPILAQPTTGLHLGLGGSSFWYRGDLTRENVQILRVLPGADFSIHFRPNERLRPGLHAGFGRIIEQRDRIPEDLEVGITPNTYVETSFFYADFRLKYFLIKSGFIRPYLSAGIGFFSFTPFDADGNFLLENIFSRPDNELYNTNRLTFPVGVGAIFSISPYLDLGLDYQRRFNVGDYLDKIGQWGKLSGPDALHQVQLTLYVRIGGRNEPYKPVPTQEQETPLASAMAVPDQLVPVSIDELSIAERQDYLTQAALDQLPDTVAEVPSQASYTYATAAELNKPAESTPLFTWITIGDTLSWEHIANDFNVGIPLLKAWNQGLPDPIPAGTRLKVPQYALEKIRKQKK